MRKKWDANFYWIIISNMELFQIICRSPFSKILSLSRCAMIPLILLILYSIFDLIISINFENE